MSSFSATYKSLFRTGRWDSEFYQDRYSQLRSCLIAMGAVPLREHAVSANRGCGPNYDPVGVVKVINSVNVRNVELSANRAATTTEEDLAACPQAAVFRNDIVITSTGIGTLGRAFCVIDDDTYFADGHITIVRLKDPALAPYICAFLQSSLGRAQMIQRRRGSSRQVELYPEDILDILIPDLPNIVIQDISNRWLSAARLVKATRHYYPEAEAELLEEMRWAKVIETPNGRHHSVSVSSLFNARRFDAEYHQKKFQSMSAHFECINAPRLKTVIHGYKKGIQPASYTTEGDTVVIKSKDVVKSGIVLENCERTYLNADEYAAGSVNAGSVVINMTGFGTLGRAAVMPHSNARTVASVDLCIISVNEKLVLPEYVAIFLNAPPGLWQSERAQTGSSGQLHLYPEHILDYRIFVKLDDRGNPDLEFQQRLVDKVNRASSDRLIALESLRTINREFEGRAGIQMIIERE